MKNILLPTDFSKNSKNAIRFALKFFEGETCHFYLLNSQKPSNYLTSEVLSGSPGNSVYDGVLNDNKKELQLMIEFCSSIAGNEDYTFVPKLDFDSIVDSVSQAVVTNNIDIIILGTNGATGASEVIFGSNTLKIIRNVDCPIIAVPENYTYHKINSVLLSINYQYNMSSTTLKILLEIVKKHQAVLKILEIEEDSIEMMGQPRNLKELFEDVTLERFHIKNLAAPIAINAFQQLIPIQLHAMFVSRKNFIDRFIFGSETSKISYGSQVPLLVMRT